ncbi:MAG: glycosyltransferase family 4 protein [Methanobacteriota archaeon]|nr:MAG: glycosyltransferase family 4 protein [Euryarchaeota archaeon]
MRDDRIRGPMRVAVLHDHLRFIGGGERVALTLASAFDADLYVTDLDPSLPSRAGMPAVRIHEIARVPSRPPLRQDRQARAFATATIPHHDVYVFSGNWSVFAAPRFRPNLWYCHTPVRVFYDLHDAFLATLPRIGRFVAQRWIRRTRAKYERAVQGVQEIVANSRNVARRIERFLSRTADVVYPPVEVAAYRFERVGDAWLAVSRISHEKRVDLLVETFRRLPHEKLLVVGGAQLGVSAERLIRSLNPPANVEFLGEIPEPRLRELYATCRGLVATSRDEDFGLAPLEAMASGKVVIAVNDGGYRESIVDGETGWLVPPTAEGIAKAIARGTPDLLRRMRSACEKRARSFDSALFVERMRALIEASVRGS